MVIIVMAIYLIIHTYRASVKHRLLRKEIREAEESVKRGFAVLKRDIQGELDIIHKLKMSKVFSEAEAKQEEQLLSDLRSVEAIIGKEIWDIAKAEFSPN